MSKLIGLAVLLFLAATAVRASSDEQILETLREKITEGYLQQPPANLVQSLDKSGLAEADIALVIEEFARAGGACFVNAAIEYSTVNDIPLADFVDGGIVSPGLGLSVTFDQLLEPCLLGALQEAGASKD